MRGNCSLAFLLCHHCGPHCCQGVGSLSVSLRILLHCSAPTAELNDANRSNQGQITFILLDGWGKHHLIEQKVLVPEGINDGNEENKLEGFCIRCLSDENINNKKAQILLPHSLCQFLFYWEQIFKKISKSHLFCVNMTVHCVLSKGDLLWWWGLYFWNVLRSPKQLKAELASPQALSCCLYLCHSSSWCF